MGAAVMARFEAWREVGFFDPTYFLYYEEVDLMLQTARAGMGMLVRARGQGGHHHGAATGVRSGEQIRRKRRPVYLYESWRHYFRKNHGRPYAIAGAMLWLVGGTLGLAIAKLRGRRGIMPVNYAADILRHVLVPLIVQRPR
jgi:N-acetylglucosaminyl-diphospho-decaprenol L-rhamnosyltransferase